MRAESEFKILDSPNPYSKNFNVEDIRDDFSVSDGEWCSVGYANPHFTDYADHSMSTWFANEDARDDLSLLSEESSTAVEGDLDVQQKMNSSNKRRKQGIRRRQDIFDGRKETKFREKVIAQGRNCNRNCIQQGKEMDDPKKFPGPLNQSSAKPARNHPNVYKRSDLNNDGVREGGCYPGESNSRLRSSPQTSGSKIHVSPFSDFSIREVLCDQEPKIHDSVQNLQGSIKYPGEHDVPSCLRLEPISFKIDSPMCCYENLFEDSKKGCGTEGSLHALGSPGRIPGNIVRDAGKRPDLFDGGKGIRSSQFWPKIDVSGGCNVLSSEKEKSVDASGSVNKCSSSKEPKEIAPEVDRTGSVCSSEYAEEMSPSIEMSTASKGNHNCSDKNQDAQSSASCHAVDEECGSPLEGMIAKRQSQSVLQNGQVMMLEAVSLNLYVCSF